jgi:hypothetical protein
MAEEKKQEEELYQRRYPALAKCVVIDARFGSRLDIVKDLKATDLFESIIEAKFVNNGLTILARGGVDACFFGPTIARETAGKFIVQAAKIPLAGDCAYVAVLPDESADAHELDKSGIHGFITKPFSKRAFADMIVRSVIAANANGVWAGIAISDLGSKADSVLGLENPGMKLATAVMSRASDSIKSIIADYRAKKFGLDQYGEPTPETAQAIGRIVAEAVSSFQLAGELAEFADFFRRSLNEWFVELVTTNEKISQANLRRRMLSFHADQRKSGRRTTVKDPK